MVEIITRAGKGAPLTNAEMDQNLDSLRNAVDTKAESVHDHNIQDVTNLQSTLDTKAESDHTHPEATVSEAGLMSSADKNKLDGIAAGATVNSTDATLRDRSTHTGAQNISTIAGLADALDAKVDTSTVGFANGVASLDTNGKVPSAQVPTLTSADITGLDAALASKADNSVALTDAAGTATLPTTAAAPIASRLQVLRNNIKQAFADLANKQATLVSGTNIKTVGGQSLLGTGNVSTGEQLPTATTISRTSGVITSMTETVGGTSRVTTITRSGGVVTQIAVAHNGSTRTETLTRTGGQVTGITVTET